MKRPLACALGEMRIITDNFFKTLEAMNHWLAWNQGDPIRFEFTHEAPGVVLVRFEFHAEKLGDAFRRETKSGIRVKPTFPGFPSRWT